MNNNILIIYNIFTNGGGETNILNIIKEFKNKFDFTIALKRYNKNTHLYNYIKNNKIKLITAPLPKPITLSKIKLLWSIFIWPILLGFKRYDKIISIEFSKATFIYKLLFLKKNGLFIWAPIGHPDDIVKHMIKFKNYAKILDLIVVESNFHKEKIQPLISKEKIEVVYSFCFNNFKRVAEQKVYNSNSLIKIGYLGRYDKNKGIFELLNIFNELSSNDYNLTLSFFGNHGDAKAELLKSVDNFKFRNKVIIKNGWNNEDEYEKILNEVDFIVLPSRSEGLPLILLESMAFGNPFVATNVGAIALLAINNPDVIIVDNDYDSIKNGIINMIVKLRSGQIDRNRLRKYYHSHFDPHKIVEKWQDIFSR